MQNFFKKNYIKFLLATLLLFHLVGNIVWIKLNNTPPRWDEAHHTNISLYFSRFLDGFFVSGNADFDLLMESMTDPYGPVVKIFAGFLMFVFGQDIKLAQFTGTIFFLASIWLVFMLSRELFGNKKGAFLSAFFYSFFPSLYNDSRWLLLDIPLLAYVLLSILLLVKSNYLKVKKYTFLFSLSLGLIALTKFQGLLYIAFPFLFYFVKAIKDKNINFLLPFAVGGILSFAAFTTWVILSWDKIVYYFDLASSGEPLVDPSNILSLQTWIYYPVLFINQNITFLLLPFFIFPLIYFAKKKSTGVYFVLLTIISYYIIFTLIPNKDLRFIYPMFAFLAISLGSGYSFIFSGKRVYKIISLSPIIFLVFWYITLSYGFPLKGYKLSFTPFGQETTLINFTEHPVRKYQTDIWPNEELLSDLSNLGPDLKYVVLIPDYQNFNYNTLKLGLDLRGDDNLILVRSDGAAEFKSNSELESFISKYKYFIYPKGRVGEPYQIDRIAFEQIKSAVEKMLFDGSAGVVKDYALPSGESVLLVEKYSF